MTARIDFPDKIDSGEINPKGHNVKVTFGDVNIIKNVTNTNGEALDAAVARITTAEGHVDDLISDVDVLDRSIPFQYMAFAEVSSDGQILNSKPPMTCTKTGNGAYELQITGGSFGHGDVILVSPQDPADKYSKQVFEGTLFLGFTGGAVDVDAPFSLLLVRGKS